MTFIGNNKPLHMEADHTEVDLDIGARQVLEMVEAAQVEAVPAANSLLEVDRVGEVLADTADNRLDIHLVAHTAQVADSPSRTAAGRMFEDWVDIRRRLAAEVPGMLGKPMGLEYCIPQVELLDDRYSLDFREIAVGAILLSSYHCNHNQECGFEKVRYSP